MTNGLIPLFVSDADQIDALHDTYSESESVPSAARPRTFASSDLPPYIKEVIRLASPHGVVPRSVDEGDVFRAIRSLTSPTPPSFFERLLGYEISPRLSLGG